MKLTDMPKDMLVTQIFVTLLMVVGLVIIIYNHPVFGLVVVCLVALYALSWLIATIIKGRYKEDGND